MDLLLSYINLLGYPEDEPKLDVEILKTAVNLGCDSPVYTHIVSWLSRELQALCDLESCIHATESADDADSFLVELRTFLKEIDCPLQGFDKESREFVEYEWEKLLDYLISSVMGNRMNRTDHPDVSQEMKVKVAESEVAKDLREMLQKLHLSKPPDDLKPLQLFTKLDSKLTEFIEKHQGVLPPPAFSGTLTENQWASLNQIQESMHEEYKRRRQTMIQRLELTKESFLWGETGQKHGEKVKEVYEDKSSSISSEPSVEVADLLSAREDILAIEKTSGEAARCNTKSSINEVVIGPVPDRGGRPEDQMPPPPEVPSWQKGEHLKTGARPKTADTSGYPAAVPFTSGPSRFETTGFSIIGDVSWRGRSRPRPRVVQRIPGRVNQHQYLMNYNPQSFPAGHQRAVYTLSAGSGHDAPPRVPFHFQPQQRFTYMPPTFAAGIGGYAPALEDLGRGQRARGRFRGNQGFRGNRGSRGHRGPRSA